MYYLADFAFENISDRALNRIYERSLTNKPVKMLIPKKKISNEVEDLQKKLGMYIQNPISRNQIINTRKIGTSQNPLGKKNIFPNSFKSQNVSTSPVVKITLTKGNKLALGLGIPTAIAGTAILVNKLKGKTWNGKDK